MGSRNLTLGHLWQIVLATLSLDIYDINYAYGSHRLNTLSLPASALPKAGIVVRFTSFCWHLLGSLYISISHKHFGLPLNQKLFFFFSSSNQRNSLLPVARACPQGCMVGLDILTRIDIGDAYRFPVIFCYLASLPFFPLVIYKLLTARGYQRRSFRYALDSYWLVYGCYLFLRIWLCRKDILAVAVASDHSVETRSLVKAAKAEGITTFYVQHASVTSEFPPLFFDYALLEGENSLHNYELAGPSCAKVFLVGMPKADKHHRYINTNATAQTIGICTNIIDPLPRVEQLCQQLRKEFPVLAIILRPHPGDRRADIWIDLAHKYYMELSESKIELSFEFLKRVDVVIAGDSNIHLESVMMNVFSLYYDFEQTHQDWYGFQRNGLVEYLAEPHNMCDRLRELFKTKPPVRMKARPYCATIGTTYDGRSSELASGTINDVASNGRVNINCWKRIPNIKLEAYELREISGDNLND